MKIGIIQQHNTADTKDNILRLGEGITDLAEKGLAILRSAAKHVADGGDIVYSTCTVTRAENLDVAKRFLESEEGGAFSLGKIGGKACFSSIAAPGAPDAHFAVRFIRK